MVNIKLVKLTGNFYYPSLARDKISGQNACHKLIADGYNARFIPLDVTSKESIQDAATKVKTEFEGLDILINNAGIMYSSSKVKNGTTAVKFT